MGWPGLKTMHYIEPDPGGPLWLSINSCQFVREWNSIPHKQRKSLYCKKGIVSVDINAFFLLIVSSYFHSYMFYR